MNRPFYITTTLPYVNNDPHVGFAMEIIRADVVARSKELDGYEVFFNTGTDEHGTKLYQAAQKEGMDVKTYVDRYAEQFRGLVDLLGITEHIHFIRTTDEHHMKAAQAFWNRCNENGYIYKKTYQAKYCVGCELEKTDSELNEEGRCPIHPDKPIELIDEENYFFAYSKLEEKLQALYRQYPDFVIPNFRFNEMKAFLSRGLQDFSISRLKEKMPWGIPVPGDEAHVMYVWFDALVNYISTLGWPEDEKTFTTYWKEGTPVQYCGKDNTRQQSSMWQAMLLAAGLPPSRHIVVNGFINSGGQKMSKSLGNVVSPYDIVALFAEVSGDLSSDVLRYYLLRHMNSFEDTDMTIDSVREAYQANLANGLGNLVSRIMTLSEQYCETFEALPTHEFDEAIKAAVEHFDLQAAMNSIWAGIGALDARIALEKPFSVVKTDVEEGKMMITSLVQSLYTLAEALAPFMPKTSERIIDLIRENKKPEAPLFARLS
jgi:methionyl-tRNA synthetase